MPRADSLDTQMRHLKAQMQELTDAFGRASRMAALTDADSVTLRSAQSATSTVDRADRRGGRRSRASLAASPSKPDAGQSPLLASTTFDDRLARLNAAFPTSRVGTGTPTGSSTGSGSTPWTISDGSCSGRAHGGGMSSGDEFGMGMGVQVHKPSLSITPSALPPQQLQQTQAPTPLHPTANVGPSPKFGNPVAPPSPAAWGGSQATAPPPPLPLSQVPPTPLAPLPSSGISHPLASVGALHGGEGILSHPTNNMSERERPGSRCSGSAVMDHAWPVAGPSPSPTPSVSTSRATPTQHMMYQDPTPSRAFGGTNPPTAQALPTSYSPEPYPPTFSNAAPMPANPPAPYQMGNFHQQQEYDRSSPVESHHSHAHTHAHTPTPPPSYSGGAFVAPSPSLSPTTSQQPTQPSSPAPGAMVNYTNPSPSPAPSNQPPSGRLPASVTVQLCRAFLESFRLPAVYFDGTYDEVFLDDVYGQHAPECGVAGGRKFTVPRNWVRFGLFVDPVRSKIDSIWDTWCVSFHGTNEKELPSVLYHRQLLLPGDTLLDGSILEPNSTRERRVYTSPSIFYSSLFAPPVEFTAANGQVLHAQMVLQCMQRPGSFQVQAGNPLVRHNPCPHMAFSELEYTSDTLSSVVPYGLLVRICEHIA